MFTPQVQYQFRSAYSVVGDGIYRSQIIHTRAIIRMKSCCIDAIGLDRQCSLPKIWMAPMVTL